MDSERGRELTWDAAFTVAERYAGSGLTAKAARRRSLRQWRVTEGITVRGTSVFEPIRWRRFFSSTWREVQSVTEASSKIGTVMRNRADGG